MSDHKPPRVAGEERETILALLQFQRDSLVRKVTGVSEVDARHSPVASGTTLLWLVKHVAYAESIWLEHRFAGDDGPVPDNTVTDADTLPAAVDAYRATWARVDRIVAAAHLDDPTRRPDAPNPVNLRWILLHLLEEIARHAGHADILRELIDGQTGR